MSFLRGVTYCLIVSLFTSIFTLGGGYILFAQYQSDHPQPLEPWQVEQLSLQPAQAIKFVPEQRKAAYACVVALRRLEWVTSAGVTYGDYGAKVSTAKDSVGDVISCVPASTFKTRVTEALNNFDDAQRYWGDLINKERVYEIGYKSNPHHDLSYYGLEDNLGHTSGQDTFTEDDKTKVLQAVWQKGSKNLSDAQAELGLVPQAMRE